MLSCNNLVKKYLTVTAVNDISVDIEPGKVYALLGPNGSGKSTFMKMVAGLTIPNSGTITMDDEPLTTKHKARIAYMPTESYFYPYMTCKDIENYYKDFFPDFSVEHFHELMEKLQLSHSDRVSKMSSGMMAKLKLAVTLARDAEIIMLDEPLNGIDLIARDNIINSIICSTSENRAIIISSHLVDELEKIIDYAIFIKNGELVRKGDAETLREESGKSIVDLYREIYA